MKFIALALITLVAVSSVRADNASIGDCLVKIDQPCGTDATCLSEFSTYSTCLKTNTCSAKTSNSDIISCINNCVPSNTLIQGYAKQQIACVSASILSFTGLIVAIFAFIF